MTARCCLFAFLACASITASAEAQNRCTGQDVSRILQPDTAVQRPVGFGTAATMTLRRTDDTPVTGGPMLPSATGRWTPATLREVVTALKADRAHLLWADGTRACWQLAVVDLPAADITAALAAAAPAGQAAAQPAPAGGGATPPGPAAQAGPVAAAAPPAAGAEPTCMGDDAIVRLAVGPVTRPMGFDMTAKAVLRGRDHMPVEAAAVLPPRTGEWNAGDVDMALLAQATEILWSQMGQTACVQTIDFATNDAGGGASGSGGEGRFTASECAIAGDGWATDIGSTTIGNFTMLVFDKNGALCARRSDRPRQGDPIFVGIFTDDQTMWSGARATYEPCSLESASPNVLTNGRLPPFNTTQSDKGSTPFDIFQKFPERRCWDPAVRITVQGPDGRALSHTVQQATRYRATFHLGTVFTESHETTFGLRPKGDDSVVYTQGPINRGPEYVAALVFYSLPRYFTRTPGGFHGRDPVADNGWKDRIGGVVGLGLADPKKRFITGLAVEVAAGVNILGVWDWVQDNTLRGVKEGDTFTGLPEEIPVQKEWRQKFVIGVSLDLVYATTAFRR